MKCTIPREGRAPLHPPRSPYLTDGRVLRAGACQVDDDQLVSHPTGLAVDQFPQFGVDVLLRHGPGLDRSPKLAHLTRLLGQVRNVLAGLQDVVGDLLLGAGVCVVVVCH